MHRRALSLSRIVAFAAVAGGGLLLATAINCSDAVEGNKGGGGGGGSAALGGAAGGSAGAHAGGSTAGAGGTSAGGAAGSASVTDGGVANAVTVKLAPLGTATAMGTAVFEKMGAKIRLTVDVTSVTPPSVLHGFHIHANPSCADSMPADAAPVPGGGAGSHWNPATHMHGVAVDGGHLGDIGNIMVDAAGAGHLVFETDLWSLGTGEPNDILNHAVVLHAATDDLMTDPSGNSGSRIACGIIKL